MVFKSFKSFQKLSLWPAVKRTCAVLNKAGFKAWLAGGCVRDGIMNIKPQDFDIATDATPEQVEGLFEKTVAVGKSFGVIRVVTKNGDIEVATFRKDGDYKDGRHPESVTYSEPEEDARRRDFTVNALFYDIAEKRVHDYVGGVADIKAKIIRTVGDPDQRFFEDKLRILRAVRFVSQLGFELDPETFRAIQRNTKEIHQVSGERLFTELNKLFSGKHFLKAMVLAEKSGLTEEILPGIKFDLKQFKATEKSKNKTLLRWLLVFQQIENPQEKNILWSRLKPSHQFQSQMENSARILHELRKFNNLPLEKRRRLSADSHMPLALEAGVALKLKVNKTFIIKNKKLPSPIVTSQMLLKLGIKPGPHFGELLENAFDAQLVGKIKNRKQALLFVEKQLTGC